MISKENYDKARKRFDDFISLYGTNNIIESYFMSYEQCNNTEEKLKGKIIHKNMIISYVENNGYIHISCTDNKYINSPPFGAIKGFRYVV